jgi:hypothetical protein
MMPARMDVCLELLVYFFAELLLNLGGELLGELGAAAANRRRTGKAKPVFMAIGFAILGGLLGWLSLLIFPNLFIKSPALRVVNLFVMPLVVGMIRLGVARWMAGKKEFEFTASPFANAAMFAFFFSWVRLIFGH